jgi:hypothetical protein
MTNHQNATRQLHGNSAHFELHTLDLTDVISPKLNTNERYVVEESFCYIRDRSRTAVSTSSLQIILEVINGVSAACLTYMWNCIYGVNIVMETNTVKINYIMDLRAVDNYWFCVTVCHYDPLLYNAIKTTLIQPTSFKVSM